jgi:hypothetical protein
LEELKRDELSNSGNNTVTTAMVYGWCAQGGFCIEATISSFVLNFWLLFCWAASNRIVWD